MIQKFTEFTTNAVFILGDEEALKPFSKPKKATLYTFIRATNNQVQLLVDTIPVTIEPNQIIALTPIQHIQVLEAEAVIVYQFNREFYCIKDHDKEVSCAGLLFFGNNSIPIVSLSNKEIEKYNILHDVFIDEIETKDTIQAEMLRMLTARFIIKTTRLLKAEENLTTVYESKVDLLRQFNLLVETHFKESHSVSFYAEKLFKSPKTLSNNFSKFEKSPIQIIHDRIVLEAKRQLSYTNKTTKEIAFDVGFEDASHLSRMFKKVTGVSPTTFKKQLLATP
ncbi:helix-turn-helix domain-containing protein [Patiriisocius hiemis]|uniref:Helix-turn-helix domain-containing protein n=1 Tax=Patiriisocius hiemis TaxID=3075604 RepID=A0ABU2YB25_9FLAO|nr:helix-turn-helix domain-containing protein [Constantimarinum sp. W242]MDT0555394.1 helix-turn-helix domain-containing protein [Constantimarinum sp. W242]